MVRSKSEFLIAETLHALGIHYQYERPLEGTMQPGRLRPVAGSVPRYMLPGPIPVQ